MKAIKENESIIATNDRIIETRNGATIKNFRVR